MKKYKSPALKHIHEEAADYFKDGIISAAKMRKFDKQCLAQEERPVQSSPRTKAAAVAAPINRNQEK